jgi:hypothetical protein
MRELDYAVEAEVECLDNDPNDVATGVAATCTARVPVFDNLNDDSSSDVH